MSFAISVVDGFVAIVGSDQRQEFSRGVDDGFVAFPHFLGRLAPGDFVAELAVGGGELGGAALQRFIQLSQTDVGFEETAVMRFERRQRLHEEILDRLHVPLIFAQSDGGQQQSDGRLLMNLGDIQHAQPVRHGPASEFVGLVQRLLPFRLQVLLQGAGVLLRQVAQGMIIHDGFRGNARRAPGRRRSL